MLYKNKNGLRNFLYQHGYLLVIVAWLATIAIIIETYFSTNASLQDVQKSIQQIVQKKERQFQKLTKDTAFINALSRKELSDDIVKGSQRYPFYIYVYQGDTTLTYWSTNTVVPSAALIYLNGSSGFVKLANGYYVWNKSFVNNNLVMGLIPVKWNYIVSNDYLHNNFDFHPKRWEEYDLAFGEDDALPVKSINGNTLFSIKQAYSKGINYNHISTVVLTVTALVILLFFIQLFAGFIAASSRPIFGMLFFSLVVILLRILSYEHFPINLRQFELFDPTIYGSSFIHRSLGDLLINTSLALWITLFIRNVLFKYKIVYVPKSFYQKLITSIICAIIMVWSVFTATNIIKSLVSDSKISFDVMNFFSLNLYSVIGFVILCFIAITFYILAQIVLKCFLTNIKPWYFYGLTLVLGLIYLSFRIGSLDGGIDIYILIWLTIFLYLQNFTLLSFEEGRIVSTRLIFWLVLFSVSITGLIVIQNKNKELQQRKYYAEALAAKADPTSETLINTMLTDFREDFLADNFHKLLNPYLNKQFKDSLIEGNVSGYTDRYVTRIYTFDKEEQQLYNVDSTSYNDLNTIYETQAKPTGIANLYYYDQSYDKYTYISKRTLHDLNGELLGYVFILSNLKEDKSEAVYPELFNRGQTNSLENSSRYAFAIYNNGKLISSYNDYPFKASIDVSKYTSSDYVEEYNKNYHELWYNAGGGRIVVIVNENSVFIETITLFSYFFCSFLVITFLIWFFNALFVSRFRFKNFLYQWQLTLRNQIHATIIFICVLSFLVIGVASILFFINRYHINNREKLSRVIHIMEKDINSFIQKETLLFQGVNDIDDVRGELEKIIRRISEVHGTDVNMYNLKGELMVSSLPLPYTKGILSTYMEPRAFFHMDVNNEVQYFQQEYIGKLSYISNYKPVIDDQGNKYAYLNIPYFSSESNLKEEISNFLVTIINLNAFIFLIAGIVAFFITNRITRSFSIISEKMRMINLEKVNEPVVWDRDDEIGELVNEFNTMLAKLDASAEALAKTEREGAWREMARQIAHEIKNPLTPMKLSMQYLQKTMDKENPHVQQLVNNVAKTMVEQIDHLSHIAGEFNQFANIERSNKEPINLNSILKSVIYLFEADERVEIKYELLNHEVRIEADKSHANRIFTNLIKNAIQAVPEDRKAVVHITETLHQQEVIVAIRDNGTGIKEELQANIFMPNFTTKTSGTGLGLAMCKRMVEHAGGRIWFETTTNVGTTFYVALPLLTQ